MSKNAHFQDYFSASFATMKYTSLQFKIRIRVWLQNNEHVQAILKPNSVQFSVLNVVCLIFVLYPIVSNFCLTNRPDPHLILIIGNFSGKYQACFSFNTII